MQHENVIHVMADKLLDFFEGSGAVNYIEQTFGCNDDPSKSFVITMQKVEGLTPCQKLADAEEQIQKLEDRLRERCEQVDELKEVCKFQSNQLDEISRVVKGDF